MLDNNVLNCQLALLIVTGSVTDNYFAQVQVIQCNILYGSGSQTGGRGPLGGHKMALGGPQRNSRI